MHALSSERSVMYNVDIFEEGNLKMSIDDIYYGIKNELMNANDFINAILLCDINDCIDLLITEFYLIEYVNKDSIMCMLTKKYIKDNYDENLASAKWQYCILNHINNYYKDIIEKKMKIEEAYVDLNYPEELEKYIGYMPFKPSKQCTTPKKCEYCTNFRNCIEKTLEDLVRKYKINLQKQKLLT